MNRSEISKTAWRKRKRGPAKGTCNFCGKKIFAGGVLMNGGRYHKSCAEAKGAGLKPAQVGKNPRAKCPRCGKFMYLTEKHLYPPKSGKRPSPVASSHRRYICEHCGKGFWDFEVAQFNPRKKRDRAPRNAHRYFGATALNPKYKFGPTGFRPPAKWFSMRAEGAAASYFGKKLKDLTKTQKDRIGQIVGGIWAKFSERTRMEILKKYEPSAVRANPKKRLLRNIHQLPCPICKTLNPVNRANTRLKCSKCGTNLIAMRVKKRGKKK